MRREKEEEGEGGEGRRRGKEEEGEGGEGNEEGEGGEGREKEGREEWGKGERGGRREGRDNTQIRNNPLSLLCAPHN